MSEERKKESIVVTGDDIVSGRQRRLPDAPSLVNVGAVMCEWAALESDLHLVLRNFLGTTNKAVSDLVTATFFQFRIVLETMKKIAPMVLDGESGERTKELKAILSTINGLATERGKIAHSVWWKDRSGDTIAVKIKKGDPEVDETTVTLDYLRDLFLRVHNADQKLMNWFAGYLQSKHQRESQQRD